MLYAWVLVVPLFLLLNSGELWVFVHDDGWPFVHFFSLPKTTFRPIDGTGGLMDGP